MVSETQDMEPRSNIFLQRKQAKKALTSKWFSWNIEVLIFIPQKTVAILQPTVDCPVHSGNACRSHIEKKGIMTLKFRIFCQNTHLLLPLGNSN